MRKFISIFLIATFGLLIENCYAMQLDLNVGNDIVNNRDKISLVYDLYYNASGLSQQHVSNEMSGIPAEMIPALVKRLKTALANIEPVDANDGKHSQISLSYIKKDGTEVKPASCQNMLAKSVMNIIFNEEGCSVN